MFPYGPFARAVGSFQYPVPPPAPAGGSCDTLTVSFPSEWLPYIIGALSQLTLQATWQGDRDTVIDTQARAAAIIGSIQHAICTPGFEAPGVGCEDECMCCLRFNNGVLQTLVCGVWTDVPGQEGGMPTTPAQPGGGSGTPPPNGGTRTYCGRLMGNNRWLLPVTVSTGDVILFSDLSGAWNDGSTLAWQCPNGYSFFAGGCWFAVPLGSPDPMPAVRHMSIIADIDGVFRDVLNADILGQPQAYTVPAGVSNQQVFIMGNTSQTGAGSGEVAFCVTVTNNQTGTWIQEFDFTQAPWTPFWQPHNDPGFTPADVSQWVSGLGWDSVATNNGMNYFRSSDIESTTPATITSIAIYYNQVSGTQSGAPQTVFALAVNGTTEIVITQPGSPVSPQVWAPSSPVNATDILIVVEAGGDTLPIDPGGTATITKVVIQGTGTNPYV